MIEIMFGKLKDWRRIHPRYDEASSNSDRKELIATFVGAAILKISFGVSS